MEGRPVWLASVSLRKGNEIIPTGEWSEDQRDEADNVLDILLKGVGDKRFERCFRMCVTMCRHRALSREETRQLPEEWFTLPAVDLAGGPVEVLWEQGIKPCLSTQPCESPTKAPLGSNTWIPIDCGSCPTCVARKEARGRPMARVD